MTWTTEDISSIETYTHAMKMDWKRPHKLVEGQYLIKSQSRNVRAGRE